MRVSTEQYISKKEKKNYPTLKNLSNLISIAGKGTKKYAHVERCVWRPSLAIYGEEQVSRTILGPCAAWDWGHDSLQHKAAPFLWLGATRVQ